MLIMRPKSSVRMMRADDIFCRASRLGTRAVTWSWQAAHRFSYTAAPETDCADARTGASAANASTSTHKQHFMRGSVAPGDGIEHRDRIGDRGSGIAIGRV